MNVFETFVVPPHISGLVGLIILFVSTLLLRVIELLTLYILAQTVSRLFVMKTGWTPERELPERFAPK